MKALKNLISINELKKQDVIQILDVAEKIQKGKIKPSLKGKLIALLFFEPSTRTRFSFETAVKRLGGETLILTGTGGSSVEKGESIGDTIKTIGQYVDLIVIRSAIEGTARYASEIVNLPVVNAGDGANQHPTQALLDLYSIRKTQGKLENLSIGIVGDLRYGRAVHSLVLAMERFKPHFYFISPPSLRIHSFIRDELSENKIKFEETEEIESVIKNLDIMYVTRIQRERFPDPAEYEKVKNCYVINKNMLKGVKENFKLLHPLPRVNEIDRLVDSTPYAYYFEQAKNGVYVRQSIITLILGGENEKIKS